MSSKQRTLSPTDVVPFQALTALLLHCKTWLQPQPLKGNPAISVFTSPEQLAADGRERRLEAAAAAVGALLDDWQVGSLRPYALCVLCPLAVTETLAVEGTQMQMIGLRS